MTKTQPKLREIGAPRGRHKAPLHLVREGEPLPELVLPPRRKIRPAGKRLTARAQSASVEHYCPLCDGAITRFDIEIFLVQGRCAPCHEALKDASPRRRRI